MPEVFDGVLLVARKSKCNTEGRHKVYLEGGLTFSRMVVIFSPIDNKCACRLGSSCLNFAAAAFPSIIKHQAVSSIGPAVIALRRLVCKPSEPGEFRAFGENFSFFQWIDVYGIASV